MIYTQEEILQVLEEANVIVKVEGGYTLNLRFKKMVNRSESFCKNFPTEMTGMPDVSIYRRVMEDCKLPLMHRGKDLSYFLRTQSKESLRTLKDILHNPQIDYQKFIKRTTKFYKSGVSVPAFANYLIKNVWETVYNDPTSDEEEARDFKGLF